MNKVIITNLVNDLGMKVLAGKNGLNKTTQSEMLSMIGMELSGFFDFFDSERIIIVGSKETNYFNSLDNLKKETLLTRIFELNPPAIIFSKKPEIPQLFLILGDKYNIPIIQSPLEATPLSGRLNSYLHGALSPRQAIHGVLIDIGGLGVLITGKSGIGKSETALELIKRGHTLIGDDRIDIFEPVKGVVVGTSPKLLKNYIEIRGIGIVDVVLMFGAGSYRDNIKINLIVELEMWQENKEYERLGLEERTQKLFNTEISKVTIPLFPGRNAAILVESAAMNQKLKIMGLNAAKNMTDAVLKASSRKKE